MTATVYRNFDKDGLAAAYDNRGHVPECEGMFADWAARSRVARDRMTSRLDLRFGDGPQETLDLHLPAAPGGAVHAFIHGGYWRALDKSEFSYLCEPLVDAGAIVANVNYDLCPAVSVETIVGQTRAALAWLYRNAEDFGAGDPRVHVSGHSAGGHLAAMMLATDWPAYGADLPADMIRSVTTISGVFDLDPIPHLPTNEDIRLDADMAHRMSPQFLDPAHDAPMTVFAGGGELSEFVRQSKDFADAWSGKLSAVEYVELAGLNHFSIVDGMDRPDDPIVRRMIAYME
ncbi:MAG: alpha/beta hydrolase [Rickettsiales bacterium]